MHCKNLNQKTALDFPLWWSLHYAYMASEFIKAGSACRVLGAGRGGGVLLTQTSGRPAPSSVPWSISKTVGPSINLDFRSTIHLLQWRCWGREIGGFSPFSPSLHTLKEETGLELLKTYMHNTTFFFCLSQNRHGYLLHLPRYLEPTNLKHLENALQIFRKPQCCHILLLKRKHCTVLS